MDAGFLRHVAKTASRSGRQLLSTRFEIERLAATCRIFGDSLALDAPDYPPSAFESSDLVHPTPASAAEEGEELGRGLHAKLLHIRQGDRRRLWMGSANATQRAWSGRNVEIIAELSIDESVEAGLMSLVAEARPIRWEDGTALKDVEAQKDELERARVEVSAHWKGEIVWDKESIRLRHSSILHPSDTRIHLEAGLITGGLETWPAGETELDLGPYQTADLTELVQLRLTLGDASCEWIMQAPATPPFGAERDRAAFMSSMGAREFLLWVADTMRGASAPPDEPDWTNDDPSRSRPTKAPPTWMADLPTQEEVFATWSRSPVIYKTIQHRVSRYLPVLLEHTRTMDPDGHTQLLLFAQMWAVCEQGLGAPL
ncbi:phospholipase D family protein [Neorhizobium galegae]|uniref:phospholipase D family protein n=1 Tax=Neorhizobium galegae TaxID=399 RepID=UPI001F3974AA|nr:phospholipase D family protein [Neorhizobium galegae]UIK06212.1 phospholipase D family protein [Neorhizobium galegae]